MVVDIPMPENIRALPMDPVRKIPVPWFVSWFDGVPEFRVVDARKLPEAVRGSLCWVCGKRLDNRCTFVVGPMCTVNRISSEPPSHPACAEYAARACPFLTRPYMARREGGLPEGTTDPAGISIKRNPGACALWTAKTPGARIFRPAGGGVLFQLLPPTSVTWWAKGRAATRDEVLESVASGLPSLARMAELDGPAAVAELARMARAAEAFYPTGVAS